MKVRDFIDTIDNRSTVDVYAELPESGCLLASTFGRECEGKKVFEERVSLYDHLTISKISYMTDNQMYDNVIIILNFN